LRIIGDFAGVSLDDESCSHVLINRSDGSQVRVIKANREWPVDEIQRVMWQ